VNTKALEWMRARLVIDGKVPPGSDLARTADEAYILELAARDPAFAEDCESVMESWPYLIRPDQGTPPITCECCGTQVTAIPESDTRTAPPYRWQNAIYETGRWRKHTPRRCGYMRDRLARP
jgi:hypothetical protein